MSNATNTLNVTNTLENYEELNESGFTNSQSKALAKVMESSMQSVLSHMDQRFEAIDKRFDMVDQRFGQVQWLIPMYFGIMTIAIVTIIAFVGFWQALPTDKLPSQWCMARLSKL